MIDLSTKEKKNAVISDFKNLLTTPGWILFEKMVQENIENVKGELLDGTKEQTIEDIKVLRKILALYTGMIELPKSMIDRLSDEAVITQESDDPYDTADSVIL